MALAPLPLTPSYAISKAAAFNLTQSLRALLAAQGVRVHAVLTGPTDTDMTRGFDIPKASAESVARAIFDGVESGEEDIFPDPMSQTVAESWRDGAAKALERENAALLEMVSRRGGLSGGRARRGGVDARALRRRPGTLHPPFVPGPGRERRGHGPRRRCAPW